MKKTFGFCIIFFTLILASCGGVSTASTLIVIEKGQSDNNKEYWIKAYDPNNQNKEDAFKIWYKKRWFGTLPEEDKEYFAMYAEKGDNLQVLENIQH